ncbi:hypothetical protein DEJ47_03035 [Streptomyces venezuelae]|uniref:Uncharacterized protein n=1 Tax=Streptomyces venezuelae TaxID=54571 RepID=A0A5P2B6Z5_STRVZ|nr:hypothetical protein DEJ47_03035 [Streptomyces venezuelae]
MEFRMHDTEGGIVGLDNLLALVPDNNWVWSVLDFDGICQGAAGLGYVEIREKVASSPQGYVMSWTQVREFAAGVRQFFDLLLVAAREQRLFDPKRLAAGDFAGCCMVLTASDSTWWSVEIDASTDGASVLAAGLRARYGVERR